MEKSLPAASSLYLTTGGWHTTSHNMRISDWVTPVKWWEGRNDLCDLTVLDWWWPLVWPGHFSPGHIQAQPSSLTPTPAGHLSSHLTASTSDWDTNINMEIHLLLIRFLFLLVFRKFLEKVLVSFILEVSVPVLPLLRLVQWGRVGLRRSPEPAPALLLTATQLRLSEHKLHFWWQIISDLLATSWESALSDQYSGEQFESRTSHFLSWSHCSRPCEVCRGISSLPWGSM